MTYKIPEIPKNATRIVLNLNFAESRMDKVLMEALRNQSTYPTLKIISRSALKDLFAQGKITIKGQIARPSSAVAKGETFVDILS